MTKVLKDLIKKIESWPKADQQELAAAVRDIEARRAGGYRISLDEREALERSQLDLDSARLASDERLKSIFRRAGLME